MPGDEKSGSGVKSIQNYSHIQGKLARLNAAITEGLRNDQLKREKGTTKPRLGAYTSSTVSTTFTTTTTTTSITTVTTTVTTTTPKFITDLDETEEGGRIKIAEKTHTYLDILRERQRVRDTTLASSSTTTSTTTSSTTPPPTTTTSTSPTSPTSPTPKTSTKEPKDHPTSHLRPQPEPPLIVPPQTTTQKADVKIVVRPNYGDFGSLNSDEENNSSEERDRIVRNYNNPNQIPVSSDTADSADSVIHDITGKKNCLIWQHCLKI